MDEAVRLSCEVRCLCLTNGGADIGVEGGLLPRGPVLVAEDARRLSEAGTTGLADVICSETRQPRTCLLLLMYKYTCSINRCVCKSARRSDMRFAACGHHSDHSLDCRAGCMGFACNSD